MTQLDANQVRALAKGAGFPESALNEAVAVSYCESKWNTDAIGDTQAIRGVKAVSVGLWQIRSKGPGSLRNRPLPEQLKDPRFNAEWAFGLWKGRGGTFALDWVTCHRRYITGQIRPPGGTGSGAGTPLTDAARRGFLAERLDPFNVAGGVGGVATRAFAVTDFLELLTRPETYIRLLYVVGGTVLILVGILVLARDLAISAIPIGRIAGALKGVKGAAAVTKAAEAVA